MFKAVIFDIGQTLVEYRIPINWSKRYRPAFEHIAEKYNYTFSEEDYQNACGVLTKYNTRIYPRDYEISSTEISEIMFVGDEEKDMVCARNAGAYAVLINRDDVIKNYGQDRMIHTLTELIQIV